MARRTRTFLITAVATAAALIPAAGASAGTLDQQQTLGGFSGLEVDNAFSKAQTFTAGLTGQLDQVYLALSVTGVTTPLTVQIRDGSATSPGDTVLASASVPTTAVASTSVHPDHHRLSRFGHRGDPVLDRGAQRSNPPSWFWYARKPADPPFAYEGGTLYDSTNGPPATGPGPSATLDRLQVQDLRRAAPAAPPPPGGSGGGSTGAASATGERAAALKTRKKKRSQTAKKKCRKKAKKKPV